jgi:hypothetical protein
MQRALVALFLAATLSACNSAPSQTASTPTTAEPAEQVEPVEPVEQAEPAEKHEHPTESTHACPMHPEITGSAEDDCTSCGMKLTPTAEPAPDAEKKEEKKEEHKGHSH